MKNVKKQIFSIVIAIVVTTSLLPTVIATEMNELTTPDGYCDNDYQKLVRFMAYENDFGVLVDSYIWQRAIQWNDDTTKRVVAIDFEDDWIGRVEGKLDVSDFNALKSINFAGFNITEINLKNTPMLEYLYISGNISKIDISESYSLKNVILRHNSITDISSFEGLENLESVNVSNNYLDLDCPNIQASIAKIQAIVDSNNGEFSYTPQRTEPTDVPTDEPTDIPTVEPTDEPTSEPTETPTDTPTIEETFVLGHILDNPTISIGDALAVLKHLAGITTLQGNALKAALITPQSQVLGKPQIGDVLEILKHLAGIESRLD